MPRVKKTTTSQRDKSLLHPSLRSGKKGKPKKTTKKTVKKKKIVPVKEEKKEKEKYYEAVGRRKTAIARIRLWTQGEKTFTVNGKPIKSYFPILELQQTAQAALEKMKCLDKFRISVKLKGGGFHAQAEAVRHGITRALVLFNPDFRKKLKKLGYLKRDPRMRERKKFGLKRARRAPQWSKR